MREKSNPEYFTSRLALLVSTLGIAIGTGNLWRFPRIIAQNGGGSFLLPYLIFLCTWSVPLLIIEFSIGKKTRRGTLGSFGVMLGEHYLWMGAFIAFCSTAIMCYYSVVMGWCIKYLLSTITHDFFSFNSEHYWNSFIASRHEPLLFHLLSMIIAITITHRGITKGIEKANYLLIPALFLILIFAALKAVNLPGSKVGLQFLFTAHLEDLLHHRIWLEALSQSAWSTGAGWGLVLTYGAYMRKREDVVVNSFLTSAGDTLASLLAALTIIPVMFAVLPHEQTPAVIGSGNVGLTFIWIPRLFKEISGGAFLLPLFFLSLCFAALSSLIAMVELDVKILMDAGVKRKHAVWTVGLIGFLYGIPSALKIEFLNNQDWTWGLGLLVNGIFLTYAVIRFGTSRFRKELINNEGNILKLGKWFDLIVNVIIPIQFICVLSWWFWQSARFLDPSGWWNPFHTFSVGTCLTQWGIVLGLLVVLNRQLGIRFLQQTSKSPAPQGRKTKYGQHL